MSADPTSRPSLRPEANSDPRPVPDLAPRLNPREVEPARYQSWLENGYFQADANQVLHDGAQPYVIVIPPPNVTAVLHMGHGLNATVQDVLVRWRRMTGRAALWVPGTDHAGIATQNVVERRLAKQGVSRSELGREGFVEAVWEFVRETGPRILDQLKAVGASCDWGRTRFTLETDLSKAVREVFVHLHDRGLVYRGRYMTNWCPRCRTALSNEEAEAREVDGVLWHLRYPLASDCAAAAAAACEAGAGKVDRLPDGRWYLTVATTRPETMLGDMGVAVHPEDGRHAPLVGAEVDLPLTGRSIPVVADSYVDPSFGSGMVKLTPAHDPNDFDIAGRAGLEALNVMTEDARMGERAPADFRGMDRVDARRAVLKALDELGLLEGSEQHRHSVPHCYRCDTVVEPRLSLQWFVRMKPLAEPALRASREGKVNFTPGRWQRVYEHWLENIRDWCISRQLWWGHRIPVWYCECGEEIVARDDPSECPSCGSVELRQDPDVLDTWFSSQLWPFSVLGWPDETDDLRAFYPGHSMVTAPEILFFWVARMIMMGMEFLGEVPFREVYLHGTVRDAQGRKMSKSLGNGIDPLEVVESHGADAMRYTLISQCAVGTDIHLDHTDVETTFASGRNFANKVWNAGRFALGALGRGPVLAVTDVADDLAVEDRWMLSRAGSAARATTRALERYRLHEAAETLYHFFWGELCDWYLELIKERLAGNGSTRRAANPNREAARATLVSALDTSLRLLHPLMPFVTSEIWSRLPWPSGTERPDDLMVADWPDGQGLRRDPDAERRIDGLIEVVGAVRRLRREYRVPDGRSVAAHLWGGEGWLGETVVGARDRLARMARIGEVVVHDGGGVSMDEQGAAASNFGAASGSPGAHAVVAGGTELFIPLEGVIDLAGERSRLRERLGQLGKRLSSTRSKLANERFVERAPSEIVARERKRLDELEREQASIENKLGRLGSRS